MGTFWGNGRKGMGTAMKMETIFFQLLKGMGATVEIFFHCSPHPVRIGVGVLQDVPQEVAAGD